MRFGFCAVGVIVFAGSALAAPLDLMGPSVPFGAGGFTPRTTLYENVPTGSETVFTTGSAPRTGGADEAAFDGTSALITSMRFGYSVAAGGPAAFDAHVRFFDDIDLNATTGPQFLNQIGDLTIPITGQTSGAFITSAVDLSGLPGGGVAATSNPANLGVSNITDVYVQIEFFQPGTTTPVANNGVTYLFYNPTGNLGPHVGYTFGSSQLGGTGQPDEVYWRDADQNGTIIGSEGRSFAAPTRANFVLELDGTAVPEPGTLGLLAMGALALLRRRS